MRWLLTALPAGILLIVQSCWVNEAPADKKHSLTIVSDFLSDEDSLLIRQFAKEQKTKVTIRVLPADSIRNRISQQRYNPEMDVLITNDDELRTYVLDHASYRKIEQEYVFRKLERQFNNTHHFWLTISHDPLVAAFPKDSTGSCRTPDFNRWHKEDSLHPSIRVLQGKSTYQAALNKSQQFSWINLNDKTHRRSSEMIYTISELVRQRNSADTTYNQDALPCFFLLAENKRYFTRTTTISMIRYSRNSIEAESFMLYYSAHGWSVANGRNELPANKGMKPNWYIESLSIQ